MIRQYGPQLAQAGYSICALQPGQKYPTYKGWQNNPLSAEACASYKPENAGVGIICGIGDVAVYGLDFDIPGDFEFAEAMRKRAFEILGDPDGAYRIGMPPKFLIPVQGKPGAQKRTTPRYIKDGASARFEFLGHGQQFVAENVHPDTGLPYEWYGEPMLPLESGHLPSSASLLPEVSSEKLAALQREFCTLALQYGWTLQDENRPALAGPLFSDDDYVPATDAELSSSAPLGISLETAEKYITDIDAGTYDEWLRVGMALHFEFSGSHEALALWDKWSRKAGNYKSFEDLEYRWKGFGHNASSSVTMATYKKRYESTHHDEAAELSDRGRACRLYQIFQGKLWFATDESAWYKWEGAHWRRLNDVEGETLATHVTGDLLLEDIKKMSAADPNRAKYFNGKFEYFRKATALTAIMAYARKLPKFQCFSSDFDSDSRYFGVANGDIDLTTGEFLAPNFERKIARYSTVSFDKDADCPLWKQTLSDVFAGRPEMPAFLQRIFGYAMLGNPVEEKIFIFHGNGSNGKSTILNTIRQIFGGYSVTMDESTVTAMGKASGSSAGSSRADILALKGKRLALVPETEDGAAMRESVVKRLVSLDAITARGVYARNMTTFTPTAVPILSTNYMPDIRGTDNGIWRRVVAVSFTQNFEGRKDVGRQTALKKELPGILNWVIEGAVAYQRGGLQIPEEVESETEGVRADMDSIQEWINDCCETGSTGYYVRSSDALASWKAWAQKNGREFHMTSTRLGRTLHGKGIQLARLSVGGRVSRCFKGIKLIDEFENLEEK